jgi:outer membrane protein
MVRRYKVGVLVACAALLSGTSWAAEYKIGFVNVERVFSQAAPAAKATKKLEKEFSSRDQELQKMGKQIRDLQSALEKNPGSESERQRKERDLQNLNRDFQRNQREFREDLNLRKSEELAGLQEKANQVIRRIAEADKFDLILQDAVYISPRIDITEKVIKALEN